MSAGRMRGHAATYGSPTLLGVPPVGYWEAVGPDAFKRALRERQDVVLNVNHSDDAVLARTTSKTLRLSSDTVGLAVDADLADTGPGRDVAELLGRGDMSKLSFAFRVRKEKWGQLDNGEEFRLILDVDLYDVSVVTRPAYDDTDAALVAEAGSPEWVRQQQRHHAAVERLEGMRVLEADLARWRHAHASARMAARRSGLPLDF